MKNLATDGFVKEEANNNPVVVRERQLSDRPAGYESFLDYNLRKSSNDELLAGAYLPTDNVAFASLAHNHLGNLGRAIIRQLPWGHDPELEKLKI